MSAEAEALDIARGLAAAGIPVFVAYPDPDKPGDYKPTARWQTTTANPAYVDAWRPGRALCAVMGHGLDLVDNDPRNGGDLAALNGILPEVLGQSATPSDGDHLFVRSMGVRSHDGVLPGIDVKAGDADGQGRGFAFIPPTVRPSKVTGELVAYQWVRPPDLTRLHDEDNSGKQLAELVRGARSPSPGSQQFSQPGTRKHAGPIPYGEHHAQLVSYAGWLRELGVPLRPEAETLMLRRLQDCVQPPDAPRPRYTEPEVIAELYDVYGRYPEGQPSARDEPPDTPSDAGHPLASRLLSGSAILDEPALPPAVWGHGEAIPWAEGEALILAGPDGVGKTTVAGQLVKGRLGLGSGSVLGMPVTPGRRRLLYLMMDRPRQIRRALARIFSEADRAALDERLVLWQGPPPVDLARNTGMLLQLCQLADADTVVVDSLKDAALKLTDDETGSGWNRARQAVTIAGIEILELHHPRKATADNTKPRTLDDLYGSRMIPAGAGSVIMLWGKAGDPVVDLIHLKQPAAKIGPWPIRADRQAGTISIDSGGDLIQQIAERGDAGITAEDAARIITGHESPERAEVQKARRQLDKLTENGTLDHRAGTRGGRNGGRPATWAVIARDRFRDRSGSDHAPITQPELPDGSDTGNPRSARHRSDNGSDHAPITNSGHPGRSHAPPPYLSKGVRDRSGVIEGTYPLQRACANASCSGRFTAEGPDDTMCGTCRVPFHCETCGQQHPVGEHQACREAAS